MFWHKRSPAEIEARIIEQARKNLRHAERWGRWWSALHIAVAIVYCLLVAFLIKLAVDMLQQLANGGEFVLGVVLGIFAGGLLYQMSHSLIAACFRRMLTAHDRLLVEYHDALRGMLDRPDKTDAASGDENGHASLTPAPLTLARGASKES